MHDCILGRVFLDGDPVLFCTKLIKATWTAARGGGNACGCAYATGYLRAGPARRLGEAYAQPQAFKT